MLELAIETGARCCPLTAAADVPVGTACARGASRGCGSSGSNPDRSTYLSGLPRTYAYLFRLCGILGLGTMVSAWMSLPRAGVIGGSAAAPQANATIWHCNRSAPLPPQARSLDIDP